MSEGIDVSSNNGLIDWVKVATQVDFVYVKATEGVSFTDPKFFNYVQGARSVGLRVGAYHFARPDNSNPQDEMAHFITVASQAKLDLPYMLDWEVPDGASPSFWTGSWAKTFLDVFVKETTHICGIYVSPGFWDGHGTTDPSVAKYPLWVAHWGVPSPQIPKPWGYYTYWQYSGGSTMDGVEGLVDKDRAQREANALAALTEAEQRQLFDNVRHIYNYLHKLDLDKTIPNMKAEIDAIKAKVGA